MISTSGWRALLVAGLFLTLATAAGPELVPSKYLDAAEEQKLIDLVPPPPVADSPEDKADLAAIIAAQAPAARTPEVVAESKLDEHFTEKLFQSVYGKEITEENSPKFYALMKEVKNVTHIVNNTAKDKYHRLRPYQDHPDVTKPLFEAKEYSYPSGHSMASFTMAVVLGSIFPDRQQAFFDRAAQIAQSRVNAGVHYPSDIKEGETLGRATAAALLEKPAFQADLEAVKAEVKKPAGG